MGDKDDPALNPELSSQVGKRVGENKSRYLSLNNFDRHGYTDGCKGCVDLASGKIRAEGGHAPHHVACRRRMEAAVRLWTPIGGQDCC